MPEMQPVNSDRLIDLMNRQRDRGDEVHQFWFVGPSGNPYWSEAKPEFSLMTGLVLQPRPDVPEYRIVDFETFSSDDATTIVRIEKVEE